LHFLAIARAFDIPWELEDFQKITDSTPFLADLKPSGKYVMEDLHNAGGVPAVMKMMLEAGIIDGSCLTVTGKTIAENLAELPGLKEGQKVIYPVNEAIKETGHLQMLFGNLASEGSVAKITGKEGLMFSGPAQVFESEDETNAAIQNREIQAGSVIVIRQSGPKGAPGMPEMLKPTGLLMGAGLGKEVALITDGRFSGGTHGFVVGHISPEGYNGGLIGLLENGDIITIDAENNTINANISEEEIAERRKNWKRPEKKLTGFLKKYRYTVASASKGCVTDEGY